MTAIVKITTCVLKKQKCLNDIVGGGGNTKGTGKRGKVRGDGGGR